MRGLEGGTAIPISTVPARKSCSSPCPRRPFSAKRGEDSPVAGPRSCSTPSRGYQRRDSRDQCDRRDRHANPCVNGCVFEHDQVLLRKRLSLVGKIPAGSRAPSHERDDLSQPSVSLLYPGAHLPQSAFFSPQFSLRPWLGSSGSLPAVSSLPGPSFPSGSRRLSLLPDCVLLLSYSLPPCLLPFSSPPVPFFLLPSSLLSFCVGPLPTDVSCLLSLSFVLLHAQGCQFGSLWKRHGFLGENPFHALRRY